MATRIIDGKKWSVSRSYDLKSQAKKAAKRYRESGYYARVKTSKSKVSGRVKNAKGKTTKVFKKTIHNVLFRKK